MYDLKNKVVLITGAATGIGSYVIRNLCEEGVKHVANIDVAEAAGNALQDELNAKYGAGKVKYYKGDVTNEEDLSKVFYDTAKQHGYIDVVINNAGILNDSMYKKQIEINVTALVSGTLKALQLMRKDEGGKGGIVINISSIAAMNLVYTTSIYNATKSAVLMFSSCIGKDEYYSKTGVKVITVAFGVTDTPLMSVEKMQSFDKEIGTMMSNSVAHFSKQTPEQAARGVVDACKHGGSGSTWVVANGAPAKDVTCIVHQAYDLLSAATM